MVALVLRAQVRRRGAVHISFHTGRQGVDNGQEYVRFESIQSRKVLTCTDSPCE